MNIQDFEKLAKARFDHCLNLMCGEKHKEYSRYDDKLYNFKRAGSILRCTHEMALAGMWIKQIVSVIDIVENVEYHASLPSENILSEKIGDTICYLVLLEALITERMLSVRLKDSPKLKKQGLP